MSDPYIVARALGKSFDGKTGAVADVSFAVQPGDIVGVLGKNGAGKTTLLELLLGFTPATAGRVQLFGYDSYRLPGAAKARVGFVPQQDELVNQLTAADQIGVIASFYPQLGRCARRAALRRVGGRPHDSESRACRSASGRSCRSCSRSVTGPTC